MKEVTRFPTGVMGRVTEGRWAFQDTRKPWDEVFHSDTMAPTLLPALAGASPSRESESSMFVNLALKESTQIIQIVQNVM